MLNKPKFMSPSINMYGNSVIDLNSDTLPFSCIVDGNEAITDFQIIISRLKDNVVVFDTGVQALEKPFFPVNNRNQNVVFSRDLKEYFSTASVNNEFVNSIDAYYWIITFKNSNSGTETYSSSEVFYANSVPNTTIYFSYNEDFTDLIDLSENFFSLQKKRVYFKSTYDQAEGVPLKRYGWRITDEANNSVLMDTITQNQIYGVADDISCVCNGLVNKTNYLLELYIETQNGYFDVLQRRKFDVNYPVKNIDVDLEVVALNNTSGIMLNWGNLRTTEGVVVGNAVSYTENFPIQSSTAIEMSENTKVVFMGTSSDKDLEIDENSYVVLSFQFDKTQSTALFEMSGTDEHSNNITRRLEYIASNRILRYIIIKGDVITTCEKQLNDIASELCWYVVTLYPLINGVADYKLIQSVSENSLFPPFEDSTEDELLYPSDDLYPYFGKWDKLRGKEVV